MISRNQMTQARIAAEEAKSIYEDMKKDAFRQMLREMEESGYEYTAFELSQLTGLSVQSITNAFVYGFGRGILSQIVHEDQDYGRSIRLGTRETVKTYILKNPDGSYDETKQLAVRGEVNTYRVVRTSR